MIQNKSPDVSEFRRNILLLPAALKEEHQLYIKEHAPRICSASTVDEMIGYLDIYWDYLNYGLLEHIVRIYGDDEIQQEMKDYREVVETFRSQTSLREFYKAQPTPRKRRRKFSESDLKEDLQYFEFKHGRLTLDSSLQIAEEFRRELAFEMSLRPCALYLFEIKEGSVLTVWSTTSSIANYIKCKIQEGQVQILRKHYILEVKMNDDIIYQGMSFYHKYVGLQIGQCDSIGYSGSFGAIIFHR